MFFKCEYTYLGIKCEGNLIKFSDDLINCIIISKGGLLHKVALHNVKIPGVRPFWQKILSGLKEIAL